MTNDKTNCNLGSVEWWRTWEKEEEWQNSLKNICTGNICSSEGVFFTTEYVVSSKRSNFRKYGTSCQYFWTKMRKLRKE